MASEPDYRFGRTVPLIVDDERQTAAVSRALGLAGVRLGRPVPIGEGAQALAAAAGVDAVVVAVGRDHGALLDELLDLLDRAAAAERFASVVVVPPALIDVAAARVASADVSLLVDPSEAEQVAAIALALARSRAGSPYLGERDARPQQLMRLSEEIQRIARTLAALSGEPDQRPPPAPPAPADEGGADGVPPSAAQIRAMIRLRRLRDHYLSPDLFADPAWDMLLDLMAARLEARPVAVSSLCIAAAVPATTALRWIKTLTDEGLLRRIADPRDGRRVFIELSETAAAALDRFFRAAARIGAGAP